MAIWVYLGALGGVGTILLLVWGTGGYRMATLTTLDAARDKLRLDWPGFSQSSGFLSGDHLTALIMESDGLQGALVYAIGNRVAVRLFSGRDIIALDARPTPGYPTLFIKLRDITRSDFTLRCPDQATLSAWQERLINCRQEAGVA